MHMCWYTSTWADALSVATLISVLSCEFSELSSTLDEGRDKRLKVHK